MRAAILSNNVVERIVVVGSLGELPGAIDATGADVGDTWDGSAFVKPAAPASIPGEVTMRQARRALLAAGLLDDVETAIDAMSEPNRTAARIDWDYSSSVRRDNATLAALAAALGLTAEQLDALFVAAAGIA